MEASDALAPCAVGSVSGSTIFSISIGAAKIKTRWVGRPCRAEWDDTQKRMLLSPTYVDGDRDS